jgi:hypothetical protein
LALSSIDFPLTIKLQIGKPERSARLSVLFRDYNTGKTGLIKDLKSLTKSQELTWDNPPPAGTYALTATLYDWSGDIIKSNEAKITIGQ